MEKKVLINILGNELPNSPIRIIVEENEIPLDVFWCQIENFLLESDYKKV